jgi:hypothetical protein
MIRVTRTARRRLEFAAGGDGREALKTPQRRCQSVNLVSVKRATCVDNMSNTGYKGYINKGDTQMNSNYKHCVASKPLPYVAPAQSRSCVLRKD